MSPQVLRSTVEKSCCNKVDKTNNLLNKAKWKFNFAFQNTNLPKVHRNEVFHCNFKICSADISFFLLLTYNLQSTEITTQMHCKRNFSLNCCILIAVNYDVQKYAEQFFNIACHIFGIYPNF